MTLSSVNLDRAPNDAHLLNPWNYRKVLPDIKLTLYIHHSLFTKSLLPLSILWKTVVVIGSGDLQVCSDIPNFVSL